MELAARTRTEYDAPLVSAAMVNGLERVPAFSQLLPPFRLYSMAETGEPPFPVRANDTWTDRLRGARTIDGAPGVALGATMVSADATPEPTTFTARTATG
jgi:hypothetical protein